MRTIVISQPLLFPWPGFFELVSLADVYVHLDDVQFSKGSFTNRVQVKHPDGVKWMTVPLVEKGRLRKIRELAASGVDWKRAHRELLAQSFRNSPHSARAMHLFDTVYKNDNLTDLLKASVEESARALDFGRKIEWLTADALASRETSWQRVLEIVIALGGTRYISAHGGADYLDHAAFERSGVAVEYIDYSKTPWPQPHGSFTPYVNVLDLIANAELPPKEHLRPATIGWKEFLSRRETQ